MIHPLPRSLPYLPMDTFTHYGSFPILCYLALGFAVTWALIGIILKVAEKNAAALVRPRDFHHPIKTPIPRLGGLAMASAFIVVAVAIYLTEPLAASSLSTIGTIVFCTLGIFAIGFWDDVRPLSAKFKFLSQIGISSIVYASNIRIELFRNPLTDADLSLGAFGYIATVFWLVAMTNLINLIDGIDGLAGGICLMLMLLMANLGVTDHLGFTMLLSIGVAGALLGFLKFNYPPAKIYMGDGGAYFLGFLIGVLSILNSNKGTVAAALIAPAFALALPIVDVSLAVVRRAASGLPIFRPDQKHIHHHLLTLGISRERTLLNLYTVSLLCLFLALCVFCLQGRLLPLYTGLLFLVLLIAGHLSGFTRSWYRVSSQLGQTLRLRKETRYALTLDRWMVLEAERGGSLEDLWEDFCFLARKLGFDKVSLILPGSVIHSWQTPTYDLLPENVHHAAHQMSDETVIEFSANKDEMSEVLFTLLGDLAAETWYKSALRFRARAQKPVVNGDSGPASKAPVGFGPLVGKSTVALTELVKP